jgi:signal transduction histidine kinase
MSEVANKVIRDYLIAIGSVAVVFALTLSVKAFVDTNVTSIYLVAVLFSAWRGGIGAGMVATFLSVLIGIYFFLPPVYSFAIKSDGVVELIVFSAAAVLVSYLSAARERALALESAARVESERANRVKDDFLATVSHELRTPLTTIKALARLLTRGDLTEEKRREYVDTISVECDRQIDLVLNLLDVSRIEGGVFRISPERVVIIDVVRSCVRSETVAAEKRGHRLEIASGIEDLPPVCADAKALRRVVSNLIENSIKYTPDGGLITVSAASGGSRATISVTDNGRGIPDEDLPVLFDKFHRGRPTAETHHGADATTTATDLLDDAEVSGVGLGLYLARNVMKRMNGEITVETEVGRGSTFTLHLPVWDEACGGGADLNG